METSTNAQSPWYAEFPAPTSTADSISRESLLQMLRDGDQKPGRDFLTVDLRRNDHEGGTIRGSLNLPAQSLWYSLETLYELCNAGNVSLVLFYCGSSRGRGTRAAGWFQDLLMQKGNTRIKSLVLAGGVKAWFDAGDEYMELVEGSKNSQTS